MDLVLSAVDMSIILLESSDSRESSKGSRELVSVQNTEIAVSHREIFIRSILRLVKQMMSRTVHRLDSISAIVPMEHEEVILVLLIMSRDLP